MILKSIDPNFIGLLVAILGHLAIIIIVLNKSEKQITSKVFALFLGSLTLWSILNYLAVSFDDPLIKLWFIRGILFFAIIQTTIFFIFSSMHAAPDKMLPIRKHKIFWLITVGAGFISASITLTPYVFKELITSPTHPLGQAVGAPGFALFATHVTLLLGLGLIKLYGQVFDRNYKLIRANLLLFIAVGVTYLLIYLLNFLLPNLFNNTAFISWAPTLTLPLVFIMAIAILKYGALDAGITFSRKAILGTAVILIMFSVLFLLL